MVNDSCNYKVCDIIKHTYIYMYICTHVPVTSLLQKYNSGLEKLFMYLAITNIIMGSYRWVFH